MANRVLDRLAAVELSESVAERLALQPGTVHLIRAWPRGDDRLILEYGGRAGARVAGQWCCDAAILEQIAKETADVAGGKAIALVGDPPARVLLQAGGADRRLRPLAALVRKRGARLVSHRPERRVVVQLPTSEGDTYVKVLRPAAAEAVLPRYGAMAQLAGEAFTVPEVLAYDALRGVIRLNTVAGTPLHDLLRTPGGARAAACAGGALRALWGAVPSREVPRHGPTEEAEIVQRWLVVLRRYVPELTVEVADLAARVKRDLEDGPLGAYTTLHRDLHDKQVLVTESGQVAFIDLDELACGETALDLANLVTHFELRAVQGDCGVETAEAAAAALIDAANPPKAVLRRLSAYVQGVRLRLACVYALRPGRRQVAIRLIEKAAAQASRNRRRNRSLAVGP